MSLLGCGEQYWCYYPDDGSSPRCYVSAQSVGDNTVISMDNTLDEGGVITNFCIDTWGAMWGDPNGWYGLDFYVNLKVFRKSGDSLLFIGESGFKHVRTADRGCWYWNGSRWFQSFCPGDFIEGPISFSCFIPGVKKGDVVGLSGGPYYPGQWGYVYVASEANPRCFRHSGDVKTDTHISEWQTTQYGRWAIGPGHGMIGIPEGVSGWLEFPDDAKTPLYNGKITVTMSRWDDDGNFDYYYEYPPVFTDKHGWFWIDTVENPFSMWDLDYYKFLLWGWTRVFIKAEMCNGQELCVSDVVWYGNYAQTELTYPVRITHRLKLKDINTGFLLSGIITTYGDGYNKGSIQLSDDSGISQWTDAHPIVITNVACSDIYAGQILHIDRRGIDVYNDCLQETEILMSPLSVGKEIYFDKEEYHPEETMHIGYDTDRTPNCKVKLFDAHGYLILTVNLGASIVSPPTVDYTIPYSIFYGLYMAELVDSGDIQLALAWVFVGTKGKLSHNIKKICTDNLITLMYDNLDPVFKAGTPPNYMKLELFDGDRQSLGQILLEHDSGSIEYHILGTEYMKKYWLVKLTDQWGNMVDADPIDVFGCKQKILGRVRRRNGNPVKLCNETLDLGFMGFDVVKAQTDADGRFTLQKLPPFPETPLKSYKGGYIKVITPVTLGEDEIKLVDIIIEGQIKGLVTDEENNPIANAYVLLEGGDNIVDIVEMSGDDGYYDIPVRVTGMQSLRFMKNNFNVVEDPIDIPEISENALQKIQDQKLTRRALELFDANFKPTNVAYETSLVQLDQVDIPNIQAGLMEMMDSGQKIALVEISGGAGDTHGTGIGAYGDGDVVCEFYGNDENGNPIIKCSYIDRLKIG